MAKSEKQKLKLLYILKILNDESNPDLPISTQELIRRLKEYEILAERRSIYDDIKQLQDFGIAVGHRKGKNRSGYYMEQRDFSLAELKILVDAVQASKFISLKQSDSLIKKLENLAGKRNAALLHRQVYVLGRVKTENDEVLNNVDLIHEALRDGKQMSFCYYMYTAAKERKLKNNGHLYHVSPWALTWNDENYYLICLDENSRSVKHFRVDKMISLTIESNLSVSRKENANFDIATYTKEMFGMYGGETDMVLLSFDESLIGVIVDRFGKEITVRPETNKSKPDENRQRFRVLVKVAVSNQFFGWVAGFQDRAEIISPPGVREQFQNYIESIRKLYL